MNIDHITLTPPVATYTCGSGQGSCLNEVTEDDLYHVSYQYPDEAEPTEEWICESCLNHLAHEELQNPAIRTTAVCLTDYRRAEEQTGTEPTPATDFGTPADGPVWTVAGIYEEAMMSGSREEFQGQISVFHIHAANAGDALTAQLDRATKAGKMEGGFLPIAIFPGALMSTI